MRGVKKASCCEVMRLVQSFVDGELNERRARRIAQHLDDCQNCGLEVALYQEIRESLRRQIPIHEPTLARLKDFVRQLEENEPPGGADTHRD
jgi:anti-sigma factor (TIGR02949 family)